MGEFDEDYHATPGVDLSAVALNIDPFTPVILTVIDLGGQEDFSALRSTYYRGAHYSILVYDISSKDSFECLSSWYAGIVQNLGTRGKSSTEALPGMLVGNKCDLEFKREVPAREARIYADLIGWEFYEASAKTGLNIKSVFLRIAKELYSRHPPVSI